MLQSKKALFFILLCLVIIAELAAVYWIITFSNFIRIIAFAFHFILVILFTFLLKRITQNTQHVEKNFILVAFILSLALPGYGMTGIFVLYLIMHKTKIQPPDYFAVDNSFLPQRSSYLIKDADRCIVSLKRDELEIEAFKDIFRSQDRQLEENAINSLSKFVNKQSVGILQDVVKHSTTDTKIMAATALIEMEDKIILKIEKLKSALDDDTSNNKLRLELARAYDLYCYLDVLDAVIKAHYQNLALEQYRQFLICDPHHAEATLEYGRILLKSGNLKEAIDKLTKSVEYAPANPTPYIWLAEAYYESANYPAVANICQKLSQYAELPIHLKEVVGLWASEEKEHQT